MNKSAQRAILILEYFAAEKRPLTLSDIGKKFSLPKSSCFDLIYTLVECGALETDPANPKAYRLGNKMFTIGAAFLDQNDLVSASRPLMTSLASSIGETVYIAIRDKNEIVYMQKVESNEPIRSTLNVGSRNNMHSSGLGKAILAATDNWESLLSFPLPKITENTITDKDALQKELEAIRRRGYAIDDREGMEFIRCVAAPIFDSSGKCIAAISVSGLDVRMNDEKLALAGEAVRAAALEISHRLGYFSNQLYK